MWPNCVMSYRQPMSEFYAGAEEDAMNTGYTYRYNIYRIYGQWRELYLL